MILPIKVHAVKIKYRELLLKNMVHGRFGMYKNKRHVFITYIPGNSTVSKHKQKRYSLNTKKGKEYSLQVKKYILVKTEYDKLLTSWRNAYSCEPPEVRFPIIQTYDPHSMNNIFFNNSVSNSNNIISEHNVYSGDIIVRSKNEQFGKDILDRLDIPYKYEPGIIDNNPRGIVPDYLLSFYEIDRCSYLEICGMSDDYEYSSRTAKKINFYSANKYRPGREVIYVFMYDKYNFDEDYFASQIMGAFETLIPDSALNWDK